MIVSGVMNLGVYPGMKLFQDMRNFPEKKVMTEIEKVNTSDYSFELAILDGWSELPGSEDGLTISSAVKILIDNPEKYHVLRNALLSMRKDGKSELPMNMSIGRRFGMMRDAAFGGRCLKKVDFMKESPIWVVRPAT